MGVRRVKWRGHKAMVFMPKGWETNKRSPGPPLGHCLERVSGSQGRKEELRQSPADVLGRGDRFGSLVGTKHLRSTGRV